MKTIGKIFIGFVVYIFACIIAIGFMVKYLSFRRLK